MSHGPARNAQGCKKGMAGCSPLARQSAAIHSTFVSGYLEGWLCSPPCLAPSPTPAHLHTAQAARVEGCVSEGLRTANILLQ